MNKARLEGEERLMGAVALWIRGQIAKHLPAGQQGVHGPVLDQATITDLVRSNLDDLARDLAGRVVDEVGVSKSRAVAPGLTQRLSVMDNSAPCSSCKEVHAIAVLDYKAGELTSVDCQYCAPEFRKG